MRDFDGRGKIQMIDSAEWQNMVYIRNKERNFKRFNAIQREISDEYLISRYTGIGGSAFQCTSSSITFSGSFHCITNGNKWALLIPDDSLIQWRISQYEHRETTQSTQKSFWREGFNSKDRLYHQEIAATPLIMNTFKSGGNKQDMGC